MQEKGNGHLASLLVCSFIVSSLHWKLKLQATIGFLSSKTLLWQKELKPQPTTWPKFVQAFCREFSKKEWDYDIVAKLKNLEMKLMSFGMYLQKFGVLQTKPTKMDKFTLVGFFVACLLDTYGIQVKNNYVTTFEDVVDFPHIHANLMTSKNKENCDQALS